MNEKPVYICKSARRMVTHFPSLQRKEETLEKFVFPCAEQPKHKGWGAPLPLLTPAHSDTPRTEPRAPVFIQTQGETLTAEIMCTYSVYFDKTPRLWVTIMYLMHIITVTPLFQHLKDHNSFIPIQRRFFPYTYPKSCHRKYRKIILFWVVCNSQQMLASPIPQYAQQRWESPGLFKSSASRNIFLHYWENNQSCVF